MMNLIIDSEGTVRCLYDEAIDLRSLGLPVIRRASHVEPNERGEWWVDLAPVDGPGLGPYATRSIALVAEAEWLLDYMLTM